MPNSTPNDVNTPSVESHDNMQASHHPEAEMDMEQFMAICEELNKPGVVF